MRPGYAALIRVIAELCTANTDRSSIAAMAKVDDVVRNVAAPVLMDAGFRRGRRTFWLDHSDGWTWGVDYYRDDAGVNDDEVRPGFAFQYRVIVPAYRDWVHRDGSAFGTQARYDHRRLTRDAASFSPALPGRSRERCNLRVPMAS
jgi:hypothetical protein